MIRTLHPIAGITAFLTIFAFWTSTVAVELAGDHAEIAAVKQAILWGLIVLIPAMALAGASGFRLGAKSANPTLASKRRRMPVIALNGLFVLVPCAIFLQQSASAGAFDQSFVLVQGVELIAGALNLTLIGLSIRDGFAITRRFAAPSQAK